MIHYSETFDKEKNHPDLRAKIIALIEKHSRSPNDLYDACRRDTHLTRPEFRKLLDEMHRDGDIRINANNRVLLPKPPPADKAARTAEPPAPTGKVENRTTPTTEILIHCLVNRSRVLKHPRQKKHLDNRYYAHRNYKIMQIPLASVCEQTLLKGYQFVPGEFIDQHDIGIRNSENWVSQQLFLLEFDFPSESTLAEFIAARPFVKGNAWLLTESLRSQYDDPHDETCNGQLRVRIAFCMPRAVNTTNERDWVYTALVKELPDCDDGSANSITSGGLGKANAAFVKIGEIVDTDWFNAAINAGRKAKQLETEAKQRAAAVRKRKQDERAAMGTLTEREGELPLAALAKSDPSLFLESLGLSLKSESGRYQHWGRHEKRGDTALSVWLSDRGNYQIRVFANSITVPPRVSGAMPFTRFYSYHEFNTDIEGLQPDSTQWKDLNAEIAARGYGTWLSDEDFRKRHATPTQTSRISNDHSGLEPVRTLPPDHPSIVNAPPSEVREGPSFRHFSEEERVVVENVLRISPDAGWHGSTPIWTPKYEYLYRLTDKFALNGQPSEVETRRVWCTRFGKCDICGAMTAKWINRYLLTAGFYCDGCHKDYPLGSYLELELNRKLPNSIVSQHQGFLGDNPDFVDFRLFAPRQLTHLGGGMGTGKTTEYIKVLTALAAEGLGKAIIAAPRVSLAHQIAYKLRLEHGHDAWGLWTEGASKSQKFFGDIGAIVCLPSLPQAVQAAEDMGVSSLYIVIDEIDFGYELLSLSVMQATAVKKVLRDALKTNGLVVVGQTESTFAIEVLAEELESDEVQGFYNTAEPAAGQVQLKQHAADVNVNAFLASGIDDISELLRNEQHVYTFCASRRDADLIAEEFSAENPVIYNAYTKGEFRSHELLLHQRLTDSRLFVGTSAAGVGISFLDKKARTVVLGGLIYGSRHANMAVQEAIRDRGRRGVLMHYKDYNLSLPVRPTENRKVSIYHEALKQAQDTANLALPEYAITKIAAAQALASLADIQFETVVRYHLGNMGNMGVVVDTPTPQPEDIAKHFGIRRAEIRKIETELKKEQAKSILASMVDAEIKPELLSSGEIRKRRNQGQLSTDGALAHELANGAARAVGWNDEVDRFQDGDPFAGLFTDADIDVALALVERNFDFKAFIKKRGGYLAVNFPKWTANRFELKVQSADRQLTLDGFGVEITAIKDYRRLGELLKTLIDVLAGQVFEEESLAATVKPVLDTTSSTGKTFGQELLSGALGASEYRKARFLHCTEDINIVNWVARFVSEWYPARLAKKEKYYALQPDTHAELYLKAFGRWLRHQQGIPDNAAIKMEIFSATELPETNAEEKEIARKRRAEGATLKAIADELGTTPKTVSVWCEGITPKKQTKQTRAARQQSRKSAKQTYERKKQERINEAYRLYTQELLSFEEIATRMNVNKSTVSRWLEKFDF